MSILPVCMCIYHALTCEEGMRVLDPLELKLGIVLRHHIGAWGPNLGPLQEQYVLLF